MIRGKECGMLLHGFIVQAFGQKTQYLKSHHHDDSDDSDATKAQQPLGQGGRVATDHTVRKAAAHLSTWKEHQRKGLSCDYRDIHLGKSATHHEQGTGHDSMTHLTNAWMQ